MADPAAAEAGRFDQTVAEVVHFVLLQQLEESGCSLIENGALDRFAVLQCFFVRVDGVDELEIEDLARALLLVVLPALDLRFVRDDGFHDEARLQAVVQL